MPTLESIYMELINYRRNAITTVDLKASPWDIEQFLKKNGWEYVDVDTDGWEHDFIITYKKDDAIIEHTGSWYFGQSVLSIKGTK